MKFTKMNGLGNDYIYINAINIAIKDPNNLAIKLSDRHFGIGGDGLVLIGKSRVADYSMRMFNADGSESEMCGNAIRCVGSYLYQNNLIDSTKVLIETLAGVKEVLLEISESKVKSVSVNMGYPKFISDRPVEVKVDDKIFTGYNVSVGNPHFVVFVEEFAENIMYFGERISNDTAKFANRTNVEFAKVVDKNNIIMRVYERGSGETLSCGTGATAVFFAAEHQNKVGSIVTLSLLGGNIICEKKQNGYFLSGEVATNFVGEYE